MKTYPAGFVQILWWILGMLVASGIALVPNLLQIRFGWDLPLALPSGSRVWIAALHALFAFGTLMLIGALIPVHVRNGLRSRRQLKSGIGMLVFAVALALTALGIYYLGDEIWGAIASTTHLIVGLSAAAVLAIHVIIAKRATNSANKSVPAIHETGSVRRLDRHVVQHHDSREQSRARMQ